MSGLRKILAEHRLEKLLKQVQYGATDWSWIADRYIEWIAENPQTETAKAFLEWLEDYPEDEPISGFFGRGVYLTIPYENQKEMIETFISDWVAEEDAENFRNYIKNLLDEGS